jgi:acyl-CoA thioesterase I
MNRFALSALHAFAVATVFGTLAASQPAQAARDALVLVVGDSISAEYGLGNAKGWVSLLSARLRTNQHAERVVNASISGDTTAGGLSRLPALLSQYKPSIVVIELGGNDALRGGTLAATRANLDAMVGKAKSAGAKVLVLGHKLPPNYGANYVREFEGVFAGVASSHKVAVVPHLFDGFGEKLEYFQPDRIHPNADAQPKILDNVWPALEPLLATAKSKSKPK